MLREQFKNKEQTQLHDDLEAAIASAESEGPGDSIAPALGLAPLGKNGLVLHRVGAAEAGVPPQMHRPVPAGAVGGAVSRAMDDAVGSLAALGVLSVSAAALGVLNGLRALAFE